MVVSAIAALAGAATVAQNTFSAAGSDASGYLSEAAMLWRGRLSVNEPLAATARWADAATTLAPLGWRAADESGLQVPTYAIGLPLLLAPLQALGGTLAAALIAPLSLVVAVWAAGALAGRLGGPHAAMLAAVWLATSPIALIEAMQPMSDVPVTAAWLVCWLFVMKRPASRSCGLSRVCWAGTAAALAVLIRPNLAPLAAVPALYLASTPPDDTHGGWTGRLRRAAAFGAPVCAAGIIVAYVHWRWFGSPLRSGYGTAGEIYALSNVSANLMLYTRWLIDTHGPWLLAAPLGALLPRARELGWLLVCGAGLGRLRVLCGVRGLDVSPLSPASIGRRDHRCRGHAFSGDGKDSGDLARSTPRDLGARGHCGQCRVRSPA